jgi:hypothetical protein
MIATIFFPAAHAIGTTSTLHGAVTSFAGASRSERSTTRFKALVVSYLLHSI